MGCQNQTATADSNYVKLRYIEEEKWGQDPSAGNMQNLRFTSESLSLRRSLITSDVISDDWQIKRVLPFDANAFGEIRGELSKYTYDDFIRSVMGEEWKDTCAPSCGGCPAGIFNGKIKFHESCALDIDTLTGKIITFDETFDHLSNNEKIVLVLGADNTDSSLYVVYPEMPDDEEIGDGDGEAPIGTYIENGRENASFYIEKEFSDVTGDNILSYSGMVVDRMSLTAEVGAKTTVAFSFLGKIDSPRAQSLLTGRTAAPISEIMDSSGNSKIYISWIEVNESGENITKDISDPLMKSISINIDNNLQNKYCVGVRKSTAIWRGRFSVTGSMTIYLQDFNLYKKIQRYVESESFRVMFTVGDLDSVHYQKRDCYAFYMPKVNITDMRIIASGANRDVIVKLDYRALKDDGSGKTLIISRT